MNQREKEEYLREYALLKAKGKPFFRTRRKDAAMACVVMAVIITMSLVLGAELGSKANRPPRRTCRVPSGTSSSCSSPARHTAAEPGSAGDDRRAHDLHDPAVPAALLRPWPGAPSRASPDSDDRRDRRDLRDGIPHIRGRERRLADGHRNGHAGGRVQAGGAQLAEYEAGKKVVAQSGCLACHKIGENGNAGPRPQP